MQPKYCSESEDTVGWEKVLTHEARDSRRFTF